MRRVVSDTGPILHLHEAGALELLPETGQILIPTMVMKEVLRWLPQWQTAVPDWLISVELHPSANDEAASWIEAGLLDAGEAAALALARHLDADWFLTDDSAARWLASQVGLEVHGSLGVVLWLAARGRLERGSAQRVLNQLFDSSLWVSHHVQAEALEALERLFTST